MEKLLIFPYNGNGIEALGCVSDQYEIIGFIDDDLSKQGKSTYGFEIYNRDILTKYKEAKILAVPGNPLNFQDRSRIIRGLEIPLERFATIISSKASISRYAAIGRNVLIMAGVVLTSNAVISDHVCILPNSVIHHDTFIGEWTLVGSNVTIAGYTSIGKNCYIGSCSSIINNVYVGDNSMLGIGTNLIKNLPENSKAVGNPARLI